MYTDISSAVINNGYTTPYFKVKCGIRQGCPLSALIFVIAVETLAISIKNNKHIKGLKIGDKEVKITQLADDTTLILNDINSLRTALNILYLFQQSSGLKLNYAKTEVLQLGEMYYVKHNPFNLKWVKDRIYALGTWFYKDVQKIIYVNYKDKLEKFLKDLKQWKCRQLTWFGKIIVLKSLAICKLNFCISTLETPEWFSSEVQIAIHDFLWNGSMPKIKQKTVINNLSCGGLGLTDIHHYIMAQRAIWAKRLCNNTPGYISDYLSLYLNGMKLQDVLYLSVKPQYLSDDIPLFYRQILYSWFLNKDKPDTYNGILSEVIWLNNEIQIGSQPVFYKRWYDSGVVYIYDLLHESGRFLTYEEFKHKYNIKCMQLKFMAVIDAIPQKWKAIMRQNTNSKFTNVCNKRLFNNTYKTIDDIRSNDIYWKYLSNIVQAPTCIDSWKSKCDFSFDDNEWKLIFNLPQSTTKDVKLREFQTKIIHRVYASNSYVSNFDHNINKNCSVCKICADICHMFYDCIYVNMFWCKLNEWLSHHISPTMLSKKDIIFGQLLPNSELINFCILHGKWFLHREYKKNNNNIPIRPIFVLFLSYLKYRLKIENYIAIKQNDNTSLLLFNKLNAIL